MSVRLFTNDVLFLRRLLAAAGNPGKKVTYARGGQSWHNFGLAWDIGLFEGGQ